MVDIRLTPAVAAVLRCFVEDADEPRYGYELMTLTGFPSGKVYPILARLHAAGWLDRTRDSSSATDGRPPRVQYRLKPERVPLVRQELAAAHSPDKTSLRPRTTPETSTP